MDELLKNNSSRSIIRIYLNVLKTSKRTFLYLLSKKVLLFFTDYFGCVFYSLHDFLKVLVYGQSQNAATSSLN